jgi:hypothetical protein
VLAEGLPGSTDPSVKGKSLWAFVKRIFFADVAGGGHSFKYIVNLWNSGDIVSKGRACRRLTNVYPF